MQEDPASLIQASIEQLERLSMALTADLEPHRRTPRLPATARRRKEALLTISVLLPKLRAACEDRTREDNA